MEMDYPEGATPLDPDEMEGLKFPHIETRGELDQLEQQNIQDGDTSDTDPYFHCDMPE